MNRQQRRAASKGAASAKGKADILCEAADSVYAAGKTEQAVKRLAAALVLDPDHVVAHTNMAFFLQAQGRFLEALPHLERSVQLDPELAMAHSNLGNVLGQLGRREDAIEHYRIALRIDPRNREAHNNWGSALMSAGEFREAADHFREAVALEPRCFDTRINLGLALAASGDTPAALHCAEIAAYQEGMPGFSNFRLASLLIKCRALDAARDQLICHLKKDPEDRQGARFLLASMGVEPMPSRTSDTQLAALYEEGASDWDCGRGREQSYHAPELVATALRRFSARSDLDIADLGCGTGLVGSLVRGRAHLLEGVDTSAAMLAKAAEKRVYDRLHHADLVGFLADRRGAFDAITCAGTLIHFGDLAPSFTLSSAALRRGGLFIATVFPNERDEDAFSVGPLDGHAQGGCFVHGRRYLAGLARGTGFDVEAIEEHTHEYLKGQPVPGLLVALRRN